MDFKIVMEYEAICKTIKAISDHHKKQWNDSNNTDYEALTVWDEARNVLESLETIQTMRLVIANRPHNLTLRVKFQHQWSIQCQEPWQRIPLWFYLFDEQSRYVAEAETVAGLIEKVGDKDASFEGNKVVKLSELIDLFEKPSSN